MLFTQPKEVHKHFEEVAKIEFSWGKRYMIFIKGKYYALVLKQWNW